MSNPSLPGSSLDSGRRSLVTKDIVVATFTLHLSSMSRAPVDSTPLRCISSRLVPPQLHKYHTHPRKPSCKGFHPSIHSPDLPNPCGIPGNRRWSRTWNQWDYRNGNFRFAFLIIYVARQNDELHLSPRSARQTLDPDRAREYFALSLCNSLRHR